MRQHPLVTACTGPVLLFSDMCRSAIFRESRNACTTQFWPATLSNAFLRTLESRAWIGDMAICANFAKKGLRAAATTTPVPSQHEIRRCCICSIRICKGGPIPYSETGIYRSKSRWPSSRLQSVESRCRSSLSQPEHAEFRGCRPSQS